MARYLTGWREPIAIHVLEGREQVLEYASLLEQLAERCGEAGSMNWLGYFLTGKGARWKRPCLVLFVRETADVRALQPEDLCAAALFYQLTALGIRTGAFSTDDWEGRRTITAPAAVRSEITGVAVETLLDRGAHVVLATYHSTRLDHTHLENLPHRTDILWAERGRAINKRQMSLALTFAETLAKFGKQTRFNLGYYRRRLAARLPYHFVGDAGELISEDECQALNASSLNPVPELECRRRFQASRHERGGFLIGLRRPSGEWLSLLGGWRQASTTVMYYQINASGYEKDSLATIMRSFFLEDEVARGTQTLVFYHGTNHPMSHAFDVEQVCDLIVRRKSVRAWMLRKLAGALVSSNYYREASYFGGSTTFLAGALTSDAMKWRSAGAEDRVPSLVYRR